MSSGGGVGGAAEEVRDLIVNRENALGLVEWFEALHDPLASLGRLMTVSRTSDGGLWRASTDITNLRGEISLMNP
jgi:hypothetical protein